MKKSPTASLVTLGCPMNQVDSERIMGGLVSLGFEIVPEDEADIIVVNTCGFIDSAREESIETILTMADFKKKGRAKALVVAGCLAERYRSDLEDELPEADAIVGLSERDRIPSICLELAGRKQKGEALYTRVVSGPLHTAYLKISEGCNNLCAYCTIPMIRGPYRSLSESDILHEAEELVSVGARELVIIGQDTTNYGIDMENGNLPSLLEKVAAIEGVEWLRLMYAHPAHITDELIEAFGSIPQLLPYIDLPIQHISQNVLRRMGRITKPDDIRSLLETLRTRVEGLVIRTSLIVGYPGETEEDFQELLDFMEDIRFERLGAFVYSPEEGTRAALLEERIPEELAAERYEEVMGLQAEISTEFQESLIGAELEMIVDEIDPESGDVFGRSYHDAPEVDGAISVAGDIPEGTEFCRVIITEAGTYDLIGEVAEEN
jgi:ribosomal protein S12 methylthiotransferase